MSVRLFSGPSGPFAATVRVPGDKSLAHRALFLAAMASGPSRITRLPPGLDVRSTAEALRTVGVTVRDEDAGATVSPGPDAWRAPPGVIDCGNSGTTMRIMAGCLAAAPFDATLTGDASLRGRPMRRLVGPLGRLGGSIDTTSGRPPITVRGRPLTGAEVWIDVPSAQVRTAVALAAIQADGASRIDSPPGYRDHTERWLESLGLGRRTGETAFEVLPGRPSPLNVELPGDPSSAAYLWAAAAITPGASVTTPRVSLNPGRLGLLSILEAMGARVTVVTTGAILGDPHGDVTVAHGTLHETKVCGVTAVRALDELPLVGVVAAFAEGATHVSDAAELRVKETDRIAATVALIRSIGGTASETPDGFTVHGSSPAGGSVDARGDHRIAMAGAVAASGGGIVAVEGFAASAVSWPGFDTVLEGVWSSR
jgi:3-phosphoshikimate 1-carboxyvinyltransferase